MIYDDRLVRLIEDVLCLVEGRRFSTRTAQRLAEEIQSDGYKRDAARPATLEKIIRSEAVGAPERP